MNEARVYTVRVWCRVGQFRAVVRAAGEEQALLFTAPAPLADFLLDAAVDGLPPDAAARLPPIMAAGPAVGRSRARKSRPPAPQPMPRARGRSPE